MVSVCGAAKGTSVDKGAPSGSIVRAEKVCGEHDKGEVSGER